MPDPNQRIVCLTEEPTEILYLLGEGHRVVGISAYTRRPPEAPRDKPVVSAFIDGSVRKIQELEPDLVIGFSDIQANLASELITAGLQVAIFNQRTLAQILDVVVSIGRLVGAEERAQELAADLQARLDNAAERSAALERRPRVYFEEWPDPAISGISWVSELITLAGGEDIFVDRSTGAMAPERFVTTEEIIARQPEMVLASWCGKPFDVEEFLSREGLMSLPAVRTGQVHEVDSTIILQPGPAAILAGLPELERLIGAWRAG